MSIGEPVVIATCDKCGNEMELTMCATAGRNSYDGRHWKAQLKRAGWATRDGDDICDGCVADGDDA